MVQFSRSLRCAPQPRSNFHKTAVWARDARRVRDHTTYTTTSGLHLLSCSASLQCNFTLLARSLARFSSYIIMDSDFAMESVSHRSGIKSSGLGYTSGLSWLSFVVMLTTVFNQLASSVSATERNRAYFCGN
jgi:hypothetical protein